MMKPTTQILLSCALSTALLSPALAGPLLIIEPDSVPEGTDIRKAFRRVTLSVERDPTREVRAVDGFDAFNGRNLATTGTLVFGYSPTLPHATGESKVWDEDTFGLLRADFKRLADLVEIDLIFDDDDTGVLRAFDACGNLLETIQASGDGRGPTSGFCPPFCAPVVTARIVREKPDIAYITAGGIETEAHFLDNLLVHISHKRARCHQ